MRHKIWMLCSAAFVSLLLLASQGVRPCGWDGPVNVSEVTFFAPEVILDPASTPFFATPFRSFYTDDAEKETPADLTQVNLDEWMSFLGGQIPREEWAATLYKAPLKRIDSLIFRLKGKADVPAQPGEAPYLAYPDRPTLVAALYYVGFAKRVEPWAMERANADPWEEKPATNSPEKEKSIQALLEGGERALAAVKIPFLQKRYAFQILRLHFYRNSFEACQKYYADHRAELAGKDSVSWRSLGYAAGALYKLKRYGEANYFYSLIFDGYRPMRLAAFWCFHPQEESDWRQCLQLAKTPREKMVLWQMLGIANDGLRAMKEIRAVDPKSDLLPLLLVREVNRAEIKARVTEATGAPAAAPPPERAALLAFVEEAAEKGDMPAAYAWDLSAAHLRAMSGDPAAAEKLLERAAGRAPGNPVVARQIRSTRIFAFLRSLTRADGAAEPRLAADLGWLKAEADKNEEPNRAQTLLTWAQHRLSVLYRAKGDIISALCLMDNDGDPLYDDPAGLARLLAFLQKKGKTPFEIFVVESYPYRPADVVELQGLNALYRGDVAAALARFETLPASGELPADPFRARIRDCNECDVTAAKKTVYTKTTFLQRLSRLLREAQADPAHAPERWFEAATGLYNITRYGNCREMYVTEGEHFRRNPRNLDCSLAESWYLKAAELSKDPEFKARAVFMAAKCEQNAFFTRNPDKEAGDFPGGKHFRTLKENYSNSLYYKEILKECGFFRKYAAGR